MGRPACKFAVALTLGGQRWSLLGVDIPVAWFFLGLPPRATDEGEDRRRYRLESDAWAESVMARGIYVAQGEGAMGLLTPALVQRLGAQRDLVARRYLSAVGWLRPEDEHFIADDEEPPRVPVPEFSPPPGAFHRAVMTMPEPGIRQAIRDVAESSHVPAHTIWRDWLISEFCWTWRLLATERPEMRAINEAALAPNVIPFRRPSVAPDRVVIGRVGSD